MTISDHTDADASDDIGPDTADIAVEADRLGVARRHLGRDTLIGGVAAAVALGAQELAAGVTRTLPSLMSGAATWIIDAAPAGMAEWAIRTLEKHTRSVLIVGVATVLVVTAMFTAELPRWIRRTLFVVVGVLGALATAHGETETFWPSLANGLLAAAVGIGTDTWFRRPRTARYDGSRRAFLGTVGMLGAVAVAAAVGGRQLLERARKSLGRRDEVVLPEAVSTVAPVTPAQDFVIEGLEPIITPTERHFRVDIDALNPPEIDLTNWTLTIGGMVDREVTLTYADLLDMDHVEKYATLACVSNKVGGRLVGNSVWLGVPLPEILELAGVDPRAEQVAAHAVDGFSTGFPLAAAYDRDTLLAIGHNGEPLTYEHGFPARLIVPGYYGFVSAAKWIQRIELTTWDDHDSYWVQMGWAKHAPVETQSRIDAPRDGLSFAAGPRMVAGVAWAPFLQISKVEVKIDDTDWVEAELSEPLSRHAWRQWRIPWVAVPGQHTISVRATDGNGVTQTSELRPAVPSGATGYHTITVQVE